MAEGKIRSPGYIATKRFLRDFPDRRVDVKACVVEAQQTDGDFAGAWALQQAKKLGASWFPNLRSLASYGILRRTHVSRQGRRAYYVMPDVEGVKAALAELEPSVE